MNFLRCCLYVGLTGVLSFLIGRLFPLSWFQTDTFLYRCRKWERHGAIYNRLHIKKWQNHVPDMSRIFPQLMHKKQLEGNLQEELPIMIRETRIAECIHGLLCLTGLFCLVLWPGWGGVLFTLLYILGNLPYILIQRYNRPRLEKLWARVSAQTEKEVPAVHGNAHFNLQYRAGT